MKEVLVAGLLSAVVIWTSGSVASPEVVRIKPTAAVTPAPSSALAPEGRTGDSLPSSGLAVNRTTPCDRYLRSAEVDVRNPRNHKFVTSNGWAERQRPRPEISVYSRVEELPPSQPPSQAPPLPTAYYQQQQQRESYYQNSLQQQPPSVRTSKRIIYYATLPDVIRPPPPGYAQLQSQGGYPPAGYSQPPFQGGYSPADPSTFGPYQADYRLSDSGRNVPFDGLQRNRLASYDNRGGGGGGGTVTSVTSKSTAVYNSRYDEPAEFREPFYRPVEFTTPKFASWAEPFYKSWTSSQWDKDLASYGNGRAGPWDREQLAGGGGGGGGGEGGSRWENRGASWDKDLVEVPLKNPGGDSRGRNGFDNSDKYPEVAVVQSGVIDVRGDRQPNGSPPAPPRRFTIVDVDPKPVAMQPQQAPMRKPLRYEAYTPMQPPTRFTDQQQGPVPGGPPSSSSSSSSPTPPPIRRYEQQYQQPASMRYGQNLPPNGYYETIKNNINTHQFMTSWTEVSTNDDVTPTRSVITDITSVGNSTSEQKNNIKIAPNMTNTTKL